MKSIPGSRFLPYLAILIATSLLVHLLLERPAQRWLLRRLSPPRPT